MKKAGRLANKAETFESLVNEHSAQYYVLFRASEPHINACNVNIV